MYVMEPAEEIYAIRVRAQILFPSNAVIRSLWKFQYANQINKWHVGKKVHLLKHRFHRINAHEGLIDYEYSVASVSDTSSNNTEIKGNSQVLTRFVDLQLRSIHHLEQHLGKREQEQQERLVFVDRLLREKKNTNYQMVNKGAVVQTLLFWEEPQWWMDKLVKSEKQNWWPREKNDSNSQEFRRLCRLLNHLVRNLLSNDEAPSTDQAVELLLQLPRAHCKLLNKLYVEPLMASLWAAYLSTTFMHHKQQHGLNTKHAAASASGPASTSNSSSPINSLRSEHPFDAKICLDMCSSCDKKEIFELMIALEKSVHSPSPCDCKYCSTLRNIANAWQYYDCGSKVWLRLEFNRRFYAKVSALLSDCITADSGNNSATNETDEEKKRSDATIIETETKKRSKTNGSNSESDDEKKRSDSINSDTKKRSKTNGSNYCETEEKKYVKSSSIYESTQSSGSDATINIENDENSETDERQHLKSSSIYESNDEKKRSKTSVSFSTESEQKNQNLSNETTNVQTDKENINKTKEPAMKIIYLSYKNEFCDRVKFMTNFVNYYAFYENSERPVSRDDCHGALREKISIIFVFALVNWELIERARKNNAAYNSISLNQQSIFKSLDNTLYAIFSENSINRMSKEKKQKLLQVNAPYVNRGFGTLPNCGTNAFTTCISSE